MSKTLLKLTAEYDDGSIEVVDKGVLTMLKEDDEEIVVQMAMLKMNHLDFEVFLNGIIDITRTMGL